MPKIVDPDCLAEGTIGPCINMDVNTTTKVITLAKTNGLSDCGVTLQAVYSKLKILWKDSSDASPCITTPFIAYDFPMVSITDEQFELVCGWSLGTKGTPNCTTKLLIRDGGWARVDANCVRQEEYMSLVTLGSFDTTNGGAGCGACNIVTGGVTFSLACMTITRTCGSWLADGFVDGGTLTVAASEDTCNNGCYTIAACCGVTATVITVTGCVINTVAAPDTTAQFTQDGTGLAYYQQDPDAACTSTVNLRGPVNQAIRIYNVTAEKAPSCLAFCMTCRTIVGAACSFNCFVPGLITISSSENCGENNGIFVVECASATTLTLNTACSLTTNAADTTARIIQANDFRKNFKIWLREEQKNYDFYDLIACQNLSNGLVNKKFALPLSDSIDNKVANLDYVIDLDPCCAYEGILINYYQTDEVICISGCMYNYRVVIDANGHRLPCVYEFVQKELRSTTDICDGGAAIAAAIIPCGVTFDQLDACAGCVPSISRTAGSWISDGFVERRTVTVASSEDGANNGCYRITCVSTLKILLDPCFGDGGTVVDSTAAPDTLATFAMVGTDLTAEVTAVTLPAQSGNICAGDYWVLNAANDKRKYHIWYQVACVGTEPVVNLSTGIQVNIATSATACAVATATHASITAAASSTEKENLLDFTAVVCAAVVTITNRNTGRTTDASDVSVGASFCSTTQGDCATTVGKIQNELLTFVGCNIVTSTGVFIENYAAADTNSITHTDVCGVGREFAFVSSGVLTFNSNLVGDGGPAKYFMYYCTTPCGFNFGTCMALLVDDGFGVDITGTICTANVCFTYAYDTNTQGGRTAAPCNDPSIKVVAIGLCSAQYVVATSTIQRSKTNNISVVAALERNYDNP